MIRRPFGRKTPNLWISRLLKNSVARHSPCFPSFLSAAV